jgi:hypothetical protein
MVNVSTNSTLHLRPSPSPRPLGSDDHQHTHLHRRREKRLVQPDMAESDVDLDSVIDRLLEVRGSRPGKQVQLLEQEIRYLCTKAREIFISQPILLELEAPIKVSRLRRPSASV